MSIYSLNDHFLKQTSLFYNFITILVLKKKGLLVLDTNFKKLLISTLVRKLFALLSPALLRLASEPLLLWIAF